MKKTIKRIVKILIYLIVFGLAGFGFWKNPQIINQIKSTFINSTTEVASPPVEIAPQTIDLTPLQEQIDEIKNKIPENIEIPDVSSKADAGAVLSLVTRLDKIEERLEKVAKATDSSALVLTAAMMVKDVTNQGGNFEMQASILSEFAAGDKKIKEQIDIINANSALGVATSFDLASQFNIIYNELLEAQKQAFETTWKDKINTKLDEFVKVRKINKNAPEFKQDEELEKIKQLVMAKQFNTAVEELQKSTNQELQINEKLKAWKDNVKTREKVLEALSKIVSQTLITMQVNSIKKETAND